MLGGASATVVSDVQVLASSAAISSSASAVKSSSVAWRGTKPNRSKDVSSTLAFIEYPGFRRGVGSEEVWTGMERMMLDVCGCDATCAGGRSSVTTVPLAAAAARQSAESFKCSRKVMCGPGEVLVVSR